MRLRWHQFFIQLSTALIAAALVSHSALALLDISITQAMDSAVPIAVVPLKMKVDRVPTLDVAQIVRQDLARSGEFNAMSPLQMREQPSDITGIHLDYWRQAGIENMVVGTMEQVDDDDYRVTVSLVDLFADKTSKTLMAKQFVVRSSLLRNLAHHISDLVYFKMTGVKGAFSTQVAYVTTEWQQGKPFRYRLQIADVDGYNPRPLLTSKEPIMSPAWSPDGRKLAYVSFEKKRAEIYISDIVTGKRRRISALPGINGAPSWSPDGTHLAVVLSKEIAPKIYTVDLRNGQLKQLTFGYSIDTEPRWLADGKTMVYTSNRGGKPQIYELNLATMDSKRLTYDGDYNARAAVADVGNKMVMIHRNERGGFNIAVQDRKTGQLHVLTNTQLDESPTLSPNGRMVMYGTLQNNKRVLGAVSIDGRVRLQLPATDGDVQEPAWSPFLS